MANKEEKSQFEKFIQAFKRANPSLGKKGCSEKAIEQWNQVTMILKDDPKSNINGRTASFDRV